MINQDEIDAAMEEAKKKMQQIQAVYIGVTATACIGGVATNHGVNISSGGTSDGISGADAVGAVLSMAGNALCGPPCGADAKVVTKLATSFKKIDSCEDRGDAKEKGSRHAEKDLSKKLFELFTNKLVSNGIVKK